MTARSNGTPALRETALSADERAAFAQRLRERIEAHIAALGLDGLADAARPAEAKELIRASHAAHRAAYLDRERRSLAPRLPALLRWFAQGEEVCPERIAPRLIPADPDRETGFVFRLATALWSVPVSRGFGRRMRFLVVDDHNQKLIGVFALGDPVFNLRVRDSWIGWGVREREQRLVGVLDAYVVGAVPPYSLLLGGKLVASLIGSREVAQEFYRRYGDRSGLISGEQKRARLALVTVTSALGRSSLYNRLRLPGLVELVRIGTTEGWGHFHFPEDIFADLRQLLAMDGHKYAEGYRYGDGPNWRIRVIRVALERIGVDGDLLRHGIAREVFAMPIAANWQQYLQGSEAEAVVCRPTVSDITAASLQRWVVPRAERRPEYRAWTTEDLLVLLAPVARQGGSLDR
jgi:hypothetical protein